MKIYVAILVLLFSGFTNASTLIDFDTVPVGSANPLTVDGFQFQATQSAYDSSPSIVGLTQEVINQSAGDNALQIGGAGLSGPFGNTSYIGVTMTAADGGAFSFYGADFSTALFGDPALMDSGIYGQVFGGGSAVDPIGSGDWLNLESVSFSLGAFFLAGGSGFSSTTLVLTIDNVNAQVVPLPAAVWLFGSALAGLGWMRRKQTV
jgi:hypothetical protein